MRKKLIALAMIIAVGTTHAADLVTTFAMNPTLSREGNPLVSLHGLNPTAFLTTQLVGTLVVFLGILLYWKLPSKRINQSEVTDVWEFASFCLYNRVLARRRFLLSMVLGHPLPRDLLQTFRYFMFVLAWALTTGSLLATLSWWSGRWGWELYRRIYFAGAIHGYPVMLPAICLGICIPASVFFFRTEYTEANNAMQSDARTSRG